MGLIQTIKRETQYLSGILRMLKSIKNVDANGTNLIPDDLEKLCDKFGPNIAFLEDDKTMTYDEMETYANRVANWALSEGCVKGDTVCVFLRNRMEYVAIWFGLSKVGIVPALLNFQLTGPALSHCVNISDAKMVIVDSEMISQWETAKDAIEGAPKVFTAFEAHDGYAHFDNVILDVEPHRPAKTARDGIIAGDQLMKMFTSGTTGLPKAAKVTHVRAQNYMRGFAAGAKTTPKDRMLMVLPMYHATGGLCG